MNKHYPLNQWPEIYADFFNNFLTIDRFAEYYGIELDYARNIIAAGQLSDNFSQPLRFPTEVTA